MKKVMYEIDKRRAARALSGEKAAAFQIERVLSAAHLAPSCFNKQPWKFVVFSSDQELERIFPALSERNSWAKRAAFLVAAVTRAEDDCDLSDNRRYALFDTGLAVENMMLQAVHEGLHAHPMAGFDPAAVKEIAKIPEDYTVITLIAFGFPGNISDLEPDQQKREDQPRERKPLDEVVFQGMWNTARVL